MARRFLGERRLETGEGWARKDDVDRVKNFSLLIIGFRHSSTFALVLLS